MATFSHGAREVGAGELDRVRAAFPRGAREKPIHYARRLNRASQQRDPNALVNDRTLTLTQLASLADTTESRLQQDSEFKILPLELDAVRAAFPRRPREKARTYAHRLNSASQQGLPDARVNDQPLTLSQLASLSGATEADLQPNPQPKALPPELALVCDAFPRHARESASAYARRLHFASQARDSNALVNGQPLSLSQLASLSGANESDLRKDSQLKPLPLELTPVRVAFPRGFREAASAYARRLNLASQQGLPDARVNDQPLTLSQLASLSGAKESHLQEDPQLKPLRPELAQVRLAFQRGDEEKGLPYARRLNLASQQRLPDALVHGQTLTLSQLSSLSGVKEADLRDDPQLKPLPVELAPVRVAFRRRDGETGIAYARRLNWASQWGLPGALLRGQALTLSQLASLSGVRESQLRQDSLLKVPPLESAPVQSGFSRE